MTRPAFRIRLWVFAGLAALAAVIPAAAHHRGVPHEGPAIGVTIPAISHGEMQIIAKYRTRILDLAAGQPVTDPTLRRLANFVSLQYFACFRGLVPGACRMNSALSTSAPMPIWPERARFSPIWWKCRETSLRPRRCKSASTQNSPAIQLSERFARTASRFSIAPSLSRRSGL